MGVEFMGSTILSYKWMSWPTNEIETAQQMVQRIDSFVQKWNTPIADEFPIKEYYWTVKRVPPLLWTNPRKLHSCKHSHLSVFSLIHWVDCFQRSATDSTSWKSSRCVVMTGALVARLNHQNTSVLSHSQLFTISQGHSQNTKTAPAEPTWCRLETE